MRIFETAESWLLKGFFLLLPIFFLPITAEFFSFNKMVLLVIVTLFSWLVWALSQTRSEFRFRVTPFDLPVLAVALVFLASTIIISPNKYDDFLFPGTTTWILAGTLLYFIVVQYLQGRREEGTNPTSLTGLLLIGTASAAVISTLSGVGAFTYLAKYLTLPAWISQNTFNVTGDLLSAITLFAVGFVLALARVIETKRTKYSPLNVFLLVLIVAGLVATIYQALPGKTGALALLPFGSGWAIALETLKRNILLGVGPGNFIEAFNRFRPVEFNSSAVWALRFTASSNWYLHVWTVAGLLGIASFAWLVLTVVKRLRQVDMSPVHWALAAVLVLFLILPATLPLLVVFYLLLAVTASHMGQDLALQFAARETGTTHKTNLLPGILALLTFVAIVAAGYWGGRAYLADMRYREALNAASKNDGKTTYEKLVAAIQLNPNVAHYRVTASQTDLAIANSIASNKDLTDEQRQTVSQLVQQAIREAQAAVVLKRTDAAYWENLARLYQSLMSFAKDADQYAISSYQNAVSFDPVNPALRISFGGMYYGLKQYDNAIRSFELAVAAKPDLANAHYNLAVALRDKGDISRAYQEMQATVSLLKTGTPDYDKAKAELDELQKKVAAAQAADQSAKAAAQTGNQQPLQAPQPAPQPVIDPKLDLPDTAAPPATESAEPSPVPVP